MDNYITIRRDFIDKLAFLDSDSIKVFLVLNARSQQQKRTRMGLSLPELARTAHVSSDTAKRSLGYLVEQELISIIPNKTNVRIIVNEYWSGVTPTPIPFTYQNTDETKLKNLETELRRQTLQLDTPSESGLAALTMGEERDIIIEIESRMGTALSTSDAYFLAKAVRGFGPERVKSTWRRMQSQKNPLRATYAALSRGVAGKAQAKTIETTPFKEVTMKELD